jgi:selenophosphate synthetase-related protein
MTLESLIEQLHRYPGIRRKKAVGRVLRELGDAWSFGGGLWAPGDDAAVLKSLPDRYHLLAADAIMQDLVRQDPYHAGRAVVLVNVNDIYAMGGRPLALVSVLAGLEEGPEREVCRGIREECRRLDVPMVGGHVSPDGASPFLAAAILGEARALLADRNARPEQTILLAVDLRGERWGDTLLNWDSHRAKDPTALAADLELLCLLAESGMAVSAKDVSNAGIIGSLAMLLEGPGLGAVVDLDRIEVPLPFTREQWLKVYPSYGYLLVADHEKAPSVRERFQDRGIWSEALGRTDDTGVLRLRSGKEEGVFIDFSCQRIFSPPPGEKRL